MTAAQPRPPLWALAAALGLHALAWGAWLPWVKQLSGAAQASLGHERDSQPRSPVVLTRVLGMAPNPAQAPVLARSPVHPALASPAVGLSSENLKPITPDVQYFRSFDATQNVASSESSKPVSSGLRAVRLPPALQLEFVVHNQRADMPIADRPARAQLRWSSDGAQYDLQLDVERWFGGPRSLRSSGQVGSDGLSPQRYSEKARAELATHLDATAGTVRFSNNRPPAKFEEGIQDRLSVLMQLSAWLAANPDQLPAGGQVSLPAAGLAGVSQWVFDVKQADPLELPPHVWNGQGQVRKLSAQPRHEFDAKFDIWLGESTQPSPWLPLALRLLRPNGDWMFLEIAADSDKGPLNMQPRFGGRGPGAP